MISTPTLLVLGAGASCEFGFPTGYELLQKVCAGLGSGMLLQRLVEMGYSEMQLREFRKALERSGQGSVDAFLEHRTEFMDIGKVAIAAVLIPFEKDGSLHNRTNDLTWYDLLFERMRAGFHAIARNELAVLTFNYDRSLEHYLFTSIQSTYGKKAEECSSVLAGIPVLHLHGTLGKHPSEGGTRDYVPTVTRETLDAAQSAIRIVHECVEDDPDFKEAHRLIGWARSIYMLGFGFHEINLDRLDISSHKHSSAKVYATGYGITSAERKVHAKRSGLQIEWGAEDQSIRDFLRKSLPFLRA